MAQTVYTGSADSRTAKFDSEKSVLSARGARVLVSAKLSDAVPRQASEPCQ